MSRRYPNPRCFKTNRSYSVAEAASCAKTHPNTIRNWLKNGLMPIDGLSPVAILGSEFKRFLTEKRKSRKKPCALNELYCLKCRKRQKPAGDMADYIPKNEKTGDLVALCPVCETEMHKLVSKTKLDELKALLNVQERQL